MSIAFLIDALRELAPTCPGGEAVLLEAAEHLAKMVPSSMEQSDWLLPPPDPQR